MALIDLKYHSDALGTGVTVYVVLPEKAKTLIGMKADGNTDTYKTLYLFHGLSDDYSIWERRTSIERYAADYNLAVVMPGVGRSWYTDTAYGPKYLTFVTEELPSVCRSYFRGMSEKREDNLVIGLSMGGYGAVKAALTHPETFGKCGSLSGALDISDHEWLMPINEWRGLFGFDLNTTKELKDTDHDIFSLVKKNKTREIPFPKLYLWCGEKDFLIQENHNFKALLEELQIPHLYEESEGSHGWNWWDLHIRSALKYLLNDGE